MKSFSNPNTTKLIKNDFIEYLSKDMDEAQLEYVLDKALKSAGSDRQKIQEKLSEVLEEALKDKDLSLQAYKEDVEAWSEYLRGENKEERIEKAKNISLFDAFTDSKKYFQLVGATSLELGRDLENLPDFDLDTFLEQENLEPVYLEEMGTITFGINIGKFTKSALEQLKVVEKIGLTKEILFANTTFVKELNIKYFIKTETEEKKDIVGYIPEIPDGLNKFSDKFREYYVDYIRRELGIASGGFVPYGQKYTRTSRPSEFASRKAEIKTEFSPLRELVINLNMGKEFNIDTNFIFNEVFNNLEDLKSEEINIYSEDITKEVIVNIQRLDYLNNLLDSLENLKELKAYELNFNVGIPSPNKKEWKTALKEKIDTSKTDALLMKPFKNIKLAIETRVAIFGNYDFSYYSKAGEIKKDKMNDHLNEIRTKIIGLGYEGVKGGI